MLEDVNIFGARATVFIKFTEPIEALAAVLVKGLHLPKFDISSSEYPPYDVMIATCDVLGFSVWLEDSSSQIEEYNYEITLRTGETLNVFCMLNKHDLSLWWANIISISCPLETLVLDIENNRVITFQ